MSARSITYAEFHSGMSELREGQKEIHQRIGAVKDELKQEINQLGNEISENRGYGKSRQEALDRIERAQADLSLKLTALCSKQTEDNTEQNEKVHRLDKRMIMLALLFGGAGSGIIEAIQASLN